MPRAKASVVVDFKGNPLPKTSVKGHHRRNLFSGFLNDARGNTTPNSQLTRLNMFSFFLVPLKVPQAPHTLSCALASASRAKKTEPDISGGGRLSARSLAGARMALDGSWSLGSHLKQRRVLIAFLLFHPKGNGRSKAPKVMVNTSKAGNLGTPALAPKCYSAD